MERKKIAVLAFSICLLITFAILPYSAPLSLAAEKPIELKLSHFWPQTSFQHEHITRWKKKIEEDSKGRLTVRIFSSGTLLGQNEEWEGLTKGVADLVYGIRLETAGREFSMKMSPFTTGGTNATMGGWMMYDIFNEFEAYRAEWKAAKVLWLACAGTNQIHTKKPVRRLEDLKGMQIRTAAAGGGVDMMKAVGASPASMPMSEVFMAIQKGTVEGATGPTEILKSFRLTEVTKYTTNANLWLLMGHYVAMNWDAYNKLPADLKKVIDNNTEWGKQDSWKMYDSIDETAIEYAKGKKHEFIELSPTEQERWEAALKPVQDKIASDIDAKGYPGTKLKDFIRQRIKHYTKAK